MILHSKCSVVVNDLTNSIILWKWWPWIRSWTTTPTSTVITTAYFDGWVIEIWFYLGKMRNISLVQKKREIQNSWYDEQLFNILSNEIPIWKIYSDVCNVPRTHTMPSVLWIPRNIKVEYCIFNFLILIPHVTLFWLDKLSKNILETFN